MVAPIGNSDHSFASAVISMAQAVPNPCVNKKFFLNINQVEYRISICVTFGLLTILLRF